MRKISVIGVGNLGSCIAYEIANRNLTDELILIDIVKDLAEGNAMDIEHAMAFKSNVKVYAGDYEDASNSDIIVVTAGKPRTPEMKSRMELLNVNKRIIQSVASKIRTLEGLDHTIIVTLTNPVDIMNYVMWRYTGFDRRRVIGSAGQLDSARFRSVLSRRLGVPVLSVEAYVIGEHGECQVPLFSRVKVDGRAKTFMADERDEIREEIRESARRVISKKGATIYAPANNTVDLIQAILEDERRLLICSAILDGEYELRGLSIGVPVIIGRSGIEEILEWELDKDEEKIFYQGAERLRETIIEIGEN